MTIEATGSAPVEAANGSINAGVDSSDLEVSSDVDVDLDPTNDPNESFESWLKRQDSKEAKVPESEKNGKKESDKSDKSLKKDDKPDNESKKVLKETKDAKDVESDEKNKEIPSPKIKLGDKEYSEPELTKELTEGKQAFEQLKTIQSQAEQLVDMLRKDPGQILDKVGANKEAIERWYYETFLEPELLTPEQRQAKSDRSRVEAFEKAESERRAKEDAEKSENLKKQYQQEFTKQIAEGLKQGGLPETDWTRNQAARHLKQALVDKRPVQMPEIVAKVKQDWVELQKSIVAGLSAEQLAEHLGEDAITKLRAHDVAKLKQDKFESKKPPVESDNKARPKKEKRKLTSVYDILENL